MFRNPMQAILQFAENRGEDANILTGRLNQVFGPVAEMLTPASAPETSPFPPPQRPRPQGPQMAPQPFVGVPSAGAGFTNVELPDGTVQRREGTRAWRNNNPGNIEFGNFARSRGAVGSDGRFAVFPTYEEGRAAKEALLFESPSYRDRTIAGAINRYAPPSENDTRNYIGGITSALGVSPDTPLSDLTPQQRDVMLNTMERIEGFRPGRVDGVDADEVYRNLGNALDMRVSSSGDLTSGDRRNVEAMLGDILNEVYDPESAVEDERRNRVADVLTGLGVGFGQMSRGDRVDLSEVRDAAERRRNQNIQLRMERAKRAAGASYAMELGDEGMARAIAGGAANINTLLTKRQMDQVEARALRQEAQQFATNESLIAALEEGGMTISDAKRTAIMNGGPAVLDTLFTQQERARALESLETKLEIDESVQTANMAIADLVSEQAEQSGDPRQLMIAQIMRAAQGTKSYAEAEAEAGNLFAPQSAGADFTLSPGQTRFDAQGNQIVSAPSVADGDVGQVAAAQNILANPEANPVQRQAAQIVLDTGGATSMTEAVASLTAGQDPEATARAERLATLTDAFSAQNLPPERAEELARGIVDGQFLELPDPETGALTIYDRTALVTGAAPQDAQVFPPVVAPSDYNPPSILASDVDYTSAFGPEGVAKNLLNNLGEAVGLGLVDAGNREAVQTVRRLATAGRIASAVEVGGRPSAYLLEMFQDLETNPAQLFTGPETALIRLQNQRDATVRELQTLDELLAPGARVNAATRGDAYSRRLALLPILSDLDVVIGGLRRSYSQEAGVTAAPSVDGPSIDELLQLYGGD